MIYFTPPKSIDNNESLVLIPKSNESIRNEDCSKSNNINNNTNTCNIEDSINILNTNSCINGTSNCINKSAKSINSLNSSPIDINTSVENVILKSSMEKYDFLSNHTDINGINILSDVPATSSINCNLQNTFILNNECTQEIENTTNLSSIKLLETENSKNVPCESIKNVEDINHKEMSNVNYSNILIDDKNDESSSYFVINSNYQLNELKEKNSNLSLNIDDSLTKVNGEIQSNSLAYDTSLPEKIKTSNNLTKPIKLNTVTTEPYPKYTPRVEKAIKKYENKQPKKECYIM